MNVITERKYCGFCKPLLLTALLNLNPEREIGNITIPINFRTESLLNEEIKQFWFKGGDIDVPPFTTFLSKSTIKTFGRTTEISGRYHIQSFDSRLSYLQFLKYLFRR